MSITECKDGVNRNITQVIECISSINRDIQTGAECIGGVNRKVFSNKQYLYNNGDVCTVLTGGWTAYTCNGSYSFTNTPTLSVVNNTGGWITVYPNNIIDVTKYSKLKFTVDSLVNRVQVGLGTGRCYNYGTLPDAYGEATTPGTYEIDISAKTGTYYIAVGTDYKSGSRSSVSAVWFE